METKTISSEENTFELKEMRLETVEELETAIAPGGFGFGCGCNGWFGAYCG